MQQCIWQGLLEYVMVTWAKALKNAKEAFIYEEVMDNFDTLCEGHNLRYFRSTLQCYLKCQGAFHWLS